MTAPSSSERADVVPADEAYAPQIQVLLDGKDVTDTILDDVIDLKVTLQKDELGGFTMQLANHFEWSLDGAKSTDGKYRHSDNNNIDVLMPVVISMGYVGRLVPTFVGEVTMMQPAFPSTGMPTFTVTGTDRLQRLRRAKPSKDTKRLFENQADWEIAKLVAARHGLGYSSRSVTKGAKNKAQSQKDMDDVTFLLHLAKRHDFEVSIVIEDNKQKLYFGLPTDKRVGEKVTQLGLRYGQSLISFTPKLGISQQLSSVTVRGWDSRTKKKFVYKATAKDLPDTGGKGKTGPERVEKQLTSKEEVIVDRPVQSQQEAKDLAVEILTEIAYQYLTGSGEAIGDPRIFPGVNLELTGLGQRFDGVYYVTKADHSYGAQGYTTSFEVKRLTDNFKGELKRV
jgi:phage protein D